MPDVNSKFKTYVKTLRDANAARDITTLVKKDEPTQRAKSAEAAADLNTCYDKGLP